MANPRFLAHQPHIESAAFYPAAKGVIGMYFAKPPVAPGVLLLKFHATNNAAAFAKTVAELCPALKTTILANEVAVASANEEGLSVSTIKDLLGMDLSDKQITPRVTAALR